MTLRHTIQSKIANPPKNGGFFLAWFLLNKVIMRTLSLTNSLYDNFLTNWDRAFFEEDYSYWRRDNHVKSSEKENSFEYYIPLAGFKKEDIKASVSDGLVAILAKKNDSTLSYSFEVPEGGDSSKLSAKHEDGLLTVTVGKSEAVKPRNIDIN